MFSLIQPFLSFFPPPLMTRELDVASMVFDPNSCMTTNHVLFLFNCWVSIPPSEDSSKPVNILSQFKVRTITHNKRPYSRVENDFLIIETMDQSNKTYLFILQRTVSRPGVTLVPDDEPSPPYRTRFERIRNFIATLAASITVPHESHLPISTEEGSSSSSSSSSPSTTFDALSIGDSPGKSDQFPVVDRFLGQNYVHSAQWHGQIVRSLKPDHLTLFELVLLAHVVHEMHPTSSILGEQSCFYVRLVYAALENLFCLSTSKSAHESKDLERNIDSHLSNNIEEETVSKVISMYKIAYLEQVAKVFFIRSKSKFLTFDTDHKSSKRASGSGEIGTYWKHSQRGMAMFKLVFVFRIFTHPQ